MKLKSYVDSRYGEVHLFRKNGPKFEDDPENLVMIMEKWRSREEENSKQKNERVSDCLDLLPRLIQRKGRAESSEYVSKVYGYFISHEHQFCTNYSKFRIGFDFFPKTLKMDLAQDDNLERREQSSNQRLTGDKQNPQIVKTDRSKYLNSGNWGGDHPLPDENIKKVRMPRMLI